MVEALTNSAFAPECSFNFVVKHFIESLPQVAVIEISHGFHYPTPHFRIMVEKNDTLGLMVEKSHMFELMVEKSHMFGLMV